MLLNQGRGKMGPISNYVHYIHFFDHKWVYFKGKTAIYLVTEVGGNFPIMITKDLLPT